MMKKIWKFENLHLPLHPLSCYGLAIWKRKFSTEETKFFEVLKQQKFIRHCFGSDLNNTFEYS